jgi:hypothetical protein
MIYHACGLLAAGISTECGVLWWAGGFNLNFAIISAKAKRGGLRDTSIRDSADAAAEFRSRGRCFGAQEKGRVPADHHNA